MTIPRPPLTAEQKQKMKKKRLRTQRAKFDPMFMRSQTKRLWRHKFADHEEVSGKRHATRFLNKKSLSLVADWARKLTTEFTNAAYAISCKNKGSLNHKTVRSAILEVLPDELVDPVLETAEAAYDAYVAKNLGV